MGNAGAGIGRKVMVVVVFRLFRMLLARLSIDWVVMLEMVDWVLLICLVERQAVMRSAHMRSAGMWFFMVFFFVLVLCSKDN